MAYTLLTQYNASVEMKALVDKYEFYIFPVVNPDGEHHFSHIFSFCNLSFFSLSSLFDFLFSLSLLFFFFFFFFFLSFRPIVGFDFS
jgi:hypothetical protein